MTLPRWLGRLSWLFGRHLVTLVRAQQGTRRLAAVKCLRCGRFI